jgi:hypothetical protein
MLTHAGSGHITYDEFIAFMAEEHADAESSAQLVEAFKVLAAGNDYVTADQLRKDLDASLAEYCIQNMSAYEGGPPGALDFKSFSSALYGVLVSLIGFAHCLQAKRICRVLECTH